jgi:response regulator RpfG family c-di-GMP phosphodiesterase
MDAKLSKSKILIVDDEEMITSVLSTMLGTWGFETQTANTPSEALNLLRQTKFDLVLLDIRMPQMSGLELLRIIRDKHPNISVIMITAVGTADAAVKALKLGAEDFITKPFDQNEIFNSIKSALDKKEIKEGTLFGLEVDLSEELIGTLNVIADVLDQIEIDSYIIPGHSKRVANHVLNMGKLMDLPRNDLTQLVVAARLHDIGKVFLSYDLRRKSVVTLTIHEKTRYESHPISGEKLLRNLKIFPKVPGIVRHHHERWSGKGFPDQLKENDIPLESRIISIAEVYDAIRFSRYDIQKKAQTEELAISYLRGGAGIMFDPELVEVFVSYIQSEVG